MEPRFFYSCANDEFPDSYDDDVIELDTPFYEDLPLSKALNSLDCSSISELMDLFLCAGERNYYSIDTNFIKNHLIRVKNTEAYVEDDVAIIKYTFEDGRVFCPNREFIIGDCLDGTDTFLLLDLAKEAAEHLFFVDCDIISSMLVFEFERWG